MNITAEQGTARHSGPEGNIERYLLQIRNMLAWALIIWGLMIAGAVGAGIYLAVHSSQQNAASNCQSFGGTDPSC